MRLFWTSALSSDFHCPHLSGLALQLPPRHQLLPFKPPALAPVACTSACPKRSEIESPKNSGGRFRANLRRHSSQTFAFVLDSGIGSRVETLFGWQTSTAPTV